MPRKPIRLLCFARLTVFSLLAGCAAGAATPGETPFFALMGDTPYSDGEIPRLDRLIADLNAARPAFVAHVGDIKEGRTPCTDEAFRARKAQLGKLRMPLYLLPGDNDWVDCHRTGFDPLERLRFWRTLFCEGKVERQEGEYCEHVRWQHEDWLFVALNVQGSNDNLAMPAEHAARSRAVLAWIDDSERLMKARRLKGLVLLMQANPFLKPRSGGPNGFEKYLEKIEALGKTHPERIVLVHGDTHTYRDDRPLTGVRRVEVHGSPFVGWLRGRAVADALDITVGGLY